MKSLFFIQLRRWYYYFEDLLVADSDNLDAIGQPEAYHFKFNNNMIPDGKLVKELNEVQSNIIILSPDKPSTFEQPWRDLIVTALCSPEKKIDNVYMFLHCKDILGVSQTHSKLESSQKRELLKLATEIKNRNKKNKKNVNVQIVVFTHEDGACHIYKRLMELAREYRFNKNVNLLKKKLEELISIYQIDKRKEKRKELIKLILEKGSNERIFEIKEKYEI